MIPKIIHYCWFGRGLMPKLAYKCIDSWRKYLPDYEIKLWNEDNFDLSLSAYAKEAYEARKFAFVTDYVRLHVLYHEGGIYMDTDVEVLKNLDSFLSYPAFSGFEGDKYVPTGIMASEKHGSWAKEQLDYYKERHFILSDGSYDMKTNSQIISSIMASNGFILENSYQIYKNSIHIFPKDYFSPIQYGKKILTSNTYCIHHFAGSWNPKRMKFKRFFYYKFLGGEISYFLVNLKRRLFNR